MHPSPKICETNRYFTHSSSQLPSQPCSHPALIRAEAPDEKTNKATALASSLIIEQIRRFAGEK